MTDLELKHWLAVTQNSRYQWTEDEVTRQNGRGALFYFGGEDGIYIRIQLEGELSLGSYEGAFPHMGEARFHPKAATQYSDFNEAFEKAVNLGGPKFLQDIFSGKPPQLLYESSESPSMEMTMM